MVNMDIPLRLEATILQQENGDGFLARVRRYCFPKPSLEKLLGRISKAAADARDGVWTSESAEQRLAAEREFFDTLARFSHRTMVHFVSRSRFRGTPAIHFMIARGTPAMIVVKTWTQDAPGSGAVVARIFKIPEHRARDFASELEKMLLRTRGLFAASQTTIFP